MEQIKRKTTAAENRAINSKKTPKTKRMKYALAHAGELVILDAELKSQCPWYESY